jgi:hypothetical protein
VSQSFRISVQPDSSEHDLGEFSVRDSIAQARQPSKAAIRPRSDAGLGPSASLVTAARGRHHRERGRREA